MELFWNWAMGVLIGVGAISISLGSVMMWRAWRAVTPLASGVITLDKTDFIPAGVPLNGFIYFMNSDGRRYRFKVVEGKLPDS